MSPIVERTGAWVSHVERSETSHQAMLSSIHYYAISPIVEMTRAWLVMSNAVRHHMKLCYYLPLLCDFSYRRNDSRLVGHVERSETSHQAMLSSIHYYAISPIVEMTRVWLVMSKCGR